MDAAEHIEHTGIDADTIRDRVEGISARIDAACRRSGRSVAEVTMIAVTKTFPVEVVQAAVAAGLRDFGENKVQELNAKTVYIPGRIAGGDVTWHMIGHLQRNKARDVVLRADLFHTLDSHRLAEVLNTQAAAAGHTFPCLVQVNISGEDTKSGLAPEVAAEFLAEMERYSHLRLQGLMGIASAVADEKQWRREFAELRRLRDTTPASVFHTEPAQLSMGMSSDFEVAIEEGATHIRIGSALFGPRQ